MSWSTLPRIHAEGRALLEGLGTGSCYTDAVSDLKQRCGDRFDEETRSRLAVRLTNCHLAASNLTTYPCDDSKLIAECTRPMVESPSAIAYKVYTTFVAHADSLCFFLSSEAFERRAEAAVNSLYNSARDATDHLRALGVQASGLVEVTGSVREGQQAAVEASAALLAGQRAAGSELQSLQHRQAAAFATAEARIASIASASRATLDDLQRDAASISSKTAAVEVVLDRVLDLQRMLLGEVSGITTVALYAFALLLLLALTTPISPLAQARLPCLGLLLLSGVSERFAMRLLVRLSALTSDDAAAADASWIWRWRIRRVAGCLMLYAALRVLLFTPRRRPRARHTGSPAARALSRARHPAASLPAAVRARQRQWRPILDARQPIDPAPVEQDGPSRLVAQLAAEAEGDVATEVVAEVVAEMVAELESEVTEEGDDEVGQGVDYVADEGTIGTDGDAISNTGGENIEEQNLSESATDSFDDAHDPGAPSPTLMPTPPSTPPPPSPSLSSVDSKPSPRCLSTRSGRLSLPPQAYWAGEGVLRQADGSYAREIDGTARLTRGTTDYTCVENRSRRGRAQGASAARGSGSESRKKPKSTRQAQEAPRMAMNEIN